MVDESNRSKSFIIYGTQDNEDDYPQDKVNGLFDILNEEKKHVDKVIQLSDSSPRSSTKSIAEVAPACLEPLT